MPMNRDTSQGILRRPSGHHTTGTHTLERVAVDPSLACISLALGLTFFFFVRPAMMNNGQRGSCRGEMSPVKTVWERARESYASTAPSGRSVLIFFWLIPPPSLTSSYYIPPMNTSVIP